MSPSEHSARNRSISLLLKRAVLTRATLNNAASLLPIEATLNNGVTTDHISADMAAVTTELTNAIDTLRTKFIHEGVPVMLLGTIFSNVFESFSYFFDQLEQHVYSQHAATKGHQHAYINANLVDGKGVISTVVALAALLPDD